jgi:hypothetical protein
MVNIDTVYQKVLTFANKEQRGYITPQEFNLFADHAQMEIFEQYFYDLNQYTKLHGSAEEYSDIVHNINEKITIFERLGTISGNSILTPDGELYRLGTVMVNNREAEEVQQNEILYINQSPLTQPTEEMPVYVRYGEGVVIHPNTITSGDCTYVKKPNAPKWGYFVLGGKALHDSDPSKTTNFELHAAEENELVYKILKFAGLSMKRDDIAKGGQGLESLQTQQEKQ